MAEYSSRIFFKSGGNGLSRSAPRLFTAAAEQLEQKHEEDEKDAGRDCDRTGGIRAAQAVKSTTVATITRRALRAAYLVARLAAPYAS